MKLAPFALAALLPLVLAMPARAADDLDSCNKGIAFIKAEIAKKPADAVAKKLAKALKDANRELGEGDFDECMDAVHDAEKATGKKSQ